MSFYNHRGGSFGIAWSSALEFSSECFYPSGSYCCSPVSEREGPEEEVLEVLQFTGEDIHIWETFSIELGNSLFPRSGRGVLTPSSGPLNTCVYSTLRGKGIWIYLCSVLQKCRWLGTLGLLNCDSCKFPWFSYLFLFIYFCRHFHSLVVRKMLSKQPVLTLLHYPSVPAWFWCDLDYDLNHFFPKRYPFALDLFIE